MSAGGLRERAAELVLLLPDGMLADAVSALERLVPKTPEENPKSESVSASERPAPAKSSENPAPKPDSKADPVTIYTDGGCHGNPGPGGWGAVIIADGDARQVSGGEALTTNNRMELTAAITALEIVRNTGRFAGRRVEIFTDSQYVKNGITSWISGWKKRGWTTAQKKAVLNQDLWKRLDEANAAVAPEWNWVKGHAGIEYNEICDELCQKEIAAFE